MIIQLLSIEDGLDNIGFRKFASYARSLNPDTRIGYVMTGNMRSLRRTFLDDDDAQLEPADFPAIAAAIGKVDILGISSMTRYTPAVLEVIRAVRDLHPETFIIWGGIHPIIHPDDAIRHVDAICTGEGEFAFEKFLKAFEAGQDFTGTPGFWFNTKGAIVKNKNLPLMTNEEMDGLPHLHYFDGETAYRRGEGFVPLEVKDFVHLTGLSYNTVWSIGCPFKCTYCANSAFIALDDKYRKLRHSSPRYIVEEIKRAVTKHPHISTIVFHDDSFMALPTRVLAEFAELYRKEIGLPFAVFGVIPNYVREEKLRILLDAGLNRIRMGIQSGSQTILDFFQRPTPVPRISVACEVIGKYSKYMIPPNYDIIVDNPVETTDDIQNTLDLIYGIPRPFTLNIFALRLIPNTTLARQLEDRGLQIRDIHDGYFSHAPTLANIAAHLIATMHLPRPVFDWFRRRALPSHVQQPLYPRLALLVRSLYLVRRGMDHLRFMDFTVITGPVSFLAWRLGLVKFGRRVLIPRFDASADPIQLMPQPGAEEKG